MQPANPMAAVLDTITKSAGDVTPREDEYTGEDGLLRCKKCGGPRQTVITIFSQQRTVRCDCGCKQAADEELRERQRAAIRNSRRAACFHDTNMATWTFENDDRACPEISDAMQRYAEQFDAMAKDGKGLLLYGPTGTGKTYMAAAIANRLIDMGRSAHMTDFSQVSDTLQGTWEKQAYIEELCRYDLLLIDDLGTERKTDYMQEQVWKVINARYRSGRPMVITSNLTQQELDHPATIEAQRIYGRILERCLPVLVSGEDRRRKAARASWPEMRAALGLNTKG